MPMSKALVACPAAFVIRPDMANYRDVPKILFPTVDQIRGRLGEGSVRLGRGPA
jgi:hypothetical protein